MKIVVSRAVSDALYAAADYIRVHGFDFHLGSRGGPRCMIGALFSQPQIACEVLEEIDARLSSIVPDTSSQVLARDGWTQDDAIAALEIAADIAYAGGR